MLSLVLGRLNVSGLVVTGLQIVSSASPSDLLTVKVEVDDA